MNELSITSGPTMSSREIADLVDARHNDVVATIERLRGKGLLRSGRETRRESTGGRPIDVYDLCQRDTHLVVAGYSDEHRARVIDRWQQLEAERVASVPQVPTTLSGALRLAADQAEQIEQQQAALALAAPKVEFVDRYVESTGNKGFREVAKLLGANERRFREFLLSKGVMYRLSGTLTPMAQHMDAGRFVVKAGANEESGHAFNQSKFTPKGVAWIAGLWMEWKLEHGDAE